MKRLAVATRLSDEFLDQLSWTHCVHFFTTPAIEATAVGNEWCHPGELGKYSRAAGNLRVSSAPASTISLKHLEELTARVSGNPLEGRSAHGYGGYWELYHWNYPGNFRPIFR